jgi:hypothetical protein
MFDLNEGEPMAFTEYQRAMRAVARKHGNRALKHLNDFAWWISMFPNSLQAGCEAKDAVISAKCAASYAFVAHPELRD